VEGATDGLAGASTGGDTLTGSAGARRLIWDSLQNSFAGANTVCVADPVRRLLLTALSAAVIWGAPAVRAADAAKPTAIDACALLTPDEVSVIVGRGVEAGQPFDNGITNQGAHSTTCIWAAPLAPGAEPDPTKRLGGRGFVVLSVMNWPGGPDDARKFLDDFQRAFEEHGIDSKPVPVEVGADDALWWGDGVAARKNGISFGVSVAQFGDKATRQPQAEMLAKLVVKRLPAR